ncbi:MAG: hypothetical protein ACKVU4_11355 [Phycisphaerales bacterium]
MIARACAVAVLAHAFIAHTGSAQAELRGEEAAPPGPIVGVDEQGVTIGPTEPAAGGPATPVVIGWDRVRGILGPRAAEFDAYRDQSDMAWRARTRLERGDAPAAEPLLEKLFQTHAGKRGPTAALVAEGLLRCRLGRGAHVAAIEAWLATLAAAGAPGAPAFHPDWASEAGLAPVIDPATGLVPAIPPIWVGPGASQVLGTSRWPGSSEAAPATKPMMLAALYAVAANFEAGQDVSLPQIDSTDAGVQLVRLVVQSRVGDAAQRHAARTTLQQRLPKPGAGPESVSPAPPWVEAWCRAAVGRSLIREPELEQKQLGIVELLLVQVRCRQGHPYLGGVALAEASAALAETGDAAGAASLRAELLSQYPEHPVLEWAPMRARPVTDPSAGQPGGPTPK